MKSFKIIPSRGLSVLFPAKWGHVIGSLGMGWLVVGGVLAAARIVNGSSDVQPPLQGVLTVLALVAIVYSIEFNPKGTRRSPFAFRNLFSRR
ncbi:hypothetical protein G6L37_02880 [Agrobacterium rubi]|nr:hypothetical protein [Agrobacterium rubi]NTF24322.1 hypothetical protein [Agrobacterium rubi]